MLKVTWIRWNAGRCYFTKKEKNIIKYHIVSKTIFPINDDKAIISCTNVNEIVKINIFKMDVHTYWSQL